MSEHFKGPIMTKAPDRSELVELIERRIGQVYDGECHLTEAEARNIIAAMISASPDGGGDRKGSAQSQPSDRRAEALSVGLGAEPSAALDAIDIKSFVDQGRKQQAARLGGDAFTDWLLALAKIAEPEDAAAWLIGSVVLNEDCWFDYFADGYTPAACWAEECSYD